MCAKVAEDVDLTSTEMVRVSLLVDRPLMDGIERASAVHGLTKSDFIRQACQKALQELDKEPDWNVLIESTRGLFYYDLVALAKRLRKNGYISPEGWAAIKSKITDVAGPAETLQGLTSPYRQLLRHLHLNPRSVEDDIKKGRITKIEGG